VIRGRVRRAPAAGVQIEYALALAVLAGGVYCVGALLMNGYLPQPFFYQAFDVWMDWFNTAFWAHNPGAYDSWRTLYPPVSFIFLKFLTLPGCYVSNEGWYSRDCDWYGMLTMHGWYVLNIFLIGKTFLKIDRKTALPRSFALAAGMPMLDGLERGNLIMVAFTCFLLAHGPLLRSARLRWLFAGLTINFKVYLIGSIFAYPIRRRWRWFEGALFATIGVYFVTWGLMGVGTPVEIYNNLAAWNDGLQQAGSLLDLWYASTYQPVIALLNGSVVPIVAMLGSWRVEFFAAFLPLLIHFVQAMIVLAAAAAWLRPEVVPTYRLVNLTSSIAIITSEGGGYTQALIIFLVFFEPWRGVGLRYAIVACYLLSIPGDLYIDPIYPQVNNGFLNAGPIFYSYWVTYGPFLRPAVVLTIPLALACVTIADVWRDIRGQGWRMRWRFRRDLPIMVGEGRATPPRALPA
jgi:hypothetical protein